jgi:hypothetical protein
VEVFSGGRIAILDDFRSLERITNPQESKPVPDYARIKVTAHPGNGSLKQIRTGGEPPIPYPQLLSTSRVSFATLESLRLGCEVEL